MDEELNINPASAKKVGSKHRHSKTGDIVLVASENTKRDKWLMGIIDAVETDGDGPVRTAVVHAGDDKIKRDVRRLLLLDVAD
ncbi:unnamed protein product [Echinostoma caproni]|uniref:DUF5641 domain-containing protein n=1 Tax=Echinostoma caproni TaxID=27848 RepID=A0A183BDR8_9TREM|nr:unnamed protein product [Echinostoma caproni]